MEPIYLPDIDRLHAFTNRSLDVVYGVCSSFEHVFGCGQHTECLNVTQTKEIQKNITTLLNLPQFRDPNGIDKLVLLVRQALSNAISTEDVNTLLEAKQSITSRIWNRITKMATARSSKQKSKWPEHTFDNETIERYGMIRDALTEQMKQYKKVFSKYQEKQKRQWKIMEKVKEYEVCLQTALTSQSHLTKCLSEVDQDRRNKTIQKLENALRKKQKKATKINAEYEKIQNEEKAMKQSLKELQMVLVQDVKLCVTKTIRDTLSSIKQIICKENMVLDNLRSLELLTAINKLDVRNIVEVIDSRNRLQLA